MKQKKKPNAAGKSDLVDVKARLNLIINKDRSPKETKSKKVVQHSPPTIETRKEEPRPSPIKSQPNRLPDGQINKLLLMRSMGF